MLCFWRSVPVGGKRNSSLISLALPLSPLYLCFYTYLCVQALSKEVNGCEKERIEEARKTVQSIAVHINETKRKREHMMKVMEIQEEMRGNLEVCSHCSGLSTITNDMPSRIWWNPFVSLYGKVHCGRVIVLIAKKMGESST